jgi:hypothetical protein
MDNSRIEQAMARIEAALARIAAAQACDAPSSGAVSSARVAQLVNTHEKLREEVAETLRDLDALIGQLEE